MCGVRQAKFSRRGIVKTDSDHDMCLQCFRSVAERNKQAIIERLMEKDSQLTADRLKQRFPGLSDGKANRDSLSHRDSKG
jgi:hypothetical protein